jgi:hypothetical protein
MAQFRAKKYSPAGISGLGYALESDRDETPDAFEVAKMTGDGGPTFGDFLRALPPWRRQRMRGVSASVPAISWDPFLLAPILS